MELPRGADRCQTFLCNEPLWSRYLTSMLVALKCDLEIKTACTKKVKEAEHERVNVDLTLMKNGENIPLTGVQHIHWDYRCDF